MPRGYQELMLNLFGATSKEQPLRLMLYCTVHIYQTHYKCKRNAASRSNMEACLAPTFRKSLRQTLTLRIQSSATAIVAASAETHNIMKQASRRILCEKGGKHQWQLPHSAITSSPIAGIISACDE